MTDDRLLDQYLAVIAEYPLDDGNGTAELTRGQFHDVVLRGQAAYRFPRDEHSRRLLPERVELLIALDGSPLPVAVPGLLSRAAVGEPLGRCHIALRRLPGQALDDPQVADSPGADPLVTSLAELLDRLSELGATDAIRKAVPLGRPPALGPVRRGRLRSLVPAHVA